jgi:hypothetical protein
LCAAAFLLTGLVLEKNPNGFMIIGVGVVALVRVYRLAAS